ncbi:PAS domain-containing protein [Emcibacter nanhaiensis]|uniref:PAS domain-containing protein n=1 Tax=Emcibacter nanhaiensis TaxID=1505037 RepID=A0A501P920_9PROT|nr:PAS domain-containing protein [Emcibacter nanhaiensis]
MNNSPESTRSFIKDLHNIEFDSHIHTQVYQYWLELKGSKSMPRKSDFNPASVVAALPFIIIAEVHNNPARYKFRLAGTKIVATLRTNISGHWLDEYENVDDVVETYSWATEHKQPCYFRDTLPHPTTDFARYSTLTLPFSSDGTNVDYLITTTHFS